MNKNNKSGYSGVYFDVKAARWRAQISLWGKKVKLGSFQTQEAAVSAREVALREYDLKRFTYGNPNDLAIAHFALQHELGVRREDSNYSLIYTTFVVPSLLYAFSTFNLQTSFVPFALKIIVSDYNHRKTRFVQNPFYNEILPSKEDKIILVKYLSGVTIREIGKQHSMSYPTAYRRIESLKSYLK